jgi:phage shock protein A
MNQETLKTNLNALERKLQILVGEHKNLKEQIGMLKQENAELKTALKGRDEQLSNFKNQVKISKIVNNLNPEESNSSELKKQVEEYIREVDKCLAYLSK